MNNLLRNPAKAIARIFPPPCRAWLSTLLLLTVLAGVSHAQQTSVTDGKTPTGMAPGAPAGSYALSGFDNINLFNGGLSFRLPLLKVGGRGSAGYTMTLPIEQKWIIKNGKTNPNTGITPMTPSPNWWQGIKPGYGAGVLHGRRTGYGEWPQETYCGQVANVFEQTLTRLTFTAADGTEYELRDQSTNGAPAYVSTVSCSSQGASRGTVFVTADGSSATFTSDATISDYKYLDINLSNRLFYPSGYLMLRDGTRYRIDGGQVSWIRDRHGNKVLFGNGAFVTDSLGRNVNVTPQTASTPYDDITFYGYGGAARTIRVNYASLGTLLRPNSGYTLQTYYQLFPLNSASTQTQYNPQKVSSVVLPDGRSYQFFYNPYGELARVVLPTGGAIEYDWAGGAYEADGVIYRYVTQRRIYADGSTLTSKTVYSRVVDGASPITVETYDGNLSSPVLLARSMHYFYGDAFQSMLDDPARPAAISYSPWQEGREYQTESFNIINSTPVLNRRVTHTWQQPVAQGNWPLTQAETDPYAKTNNPQITQSVTTLLDTSPNQVTKQSFAYDAYSNQTDVYEYDYGAGAAPAYPTRHTHTDYLSTNAANGLNYQSDPAIHLRGLPTGMKVYAVNTSTGAETLFAQDEVRYDETGYPLLPCAGIIGWTDPATTARGNATTTRRWLNTDNSYLETHAQYDQAGNVRYGWDARGFQSQIDYTDSFSDGVTRNTFAYPKRTISPVPGAPYGSTTALEATSVYDYSTGLVTSTTDANNQLTTIEYNDPLERPTRVVRPTGGGWTTYEYDRFQNHDYIHTQSLQNSSGLVADSYQFFDGLGRPYRSFQYEGVDPTNVYLTIDTQYDALGRVWRVSNIYRSVNSTGAINPSGNWTTTAYDALGRVTSVTTPDNAVVTTDYSGNQVTVTDQAQKKRRSITDALGRLIQVIEDPITATNPNGLSYQTDYLYDVSGNLRKVTQGTQSRYFMYDSLSRLIRAKNPEQNVNTNLTGADAVTGNSQWAMSYSYDANSNLLSRTDARGLTANYTYDSLNRNIRVAYPDTNHAHTDHFFDDATGGRGQMYYSVSYGNTGQVETANVIDGYDAVGRPLNQRQRFWVNGAWGESYNVQRAYDLAGHVATQTYPSGRTVSYTYDRMGRTISFGGNIGDGVSRTYMSAAAFNESGRMTREQFGTDTPLYNKRHYNVRGQLYDIRLSSVNDDSDWNRGAIVNYYSLTNPTFGASGADNNGNLHIQQVWLPGGSYTQQNYAYDSLNRLSSVGEYQNGGTLTGVQNYTYDRWGNRTIASTSSGTGINAQQFTVDTATNRLGVPAGQAGVMTYDANGNLTNDTYTGFGTRTYDAENRMVSATDNGGGVSQYTYNGEGQRVKRQTGAQQTWQVYGMEGELVAEYAANALPTAPNKEYGYRNGELLVTVETPTSTGINVALNRTATQSSDLVGGVAGRAVDGNTNGDWNYSSVTHTDYNNQGWWEVDLGSVQSLSSVKVWNRTDCCGSRLSNFYIFVSDAPFTSHDLTTTMGQSGVASYYTAGAAGTSVTQAVNRTGRYVRVQLAGTDYLSLAEVQVFSANAATGIEWLVSDQLGTPRMVADKSGTLSGIKRHDYLPFGEELFAGTGGRTSAQGFVADGVRQKFTQKERDVETGLDYFLARYYSSIQGRFTSPDEFTGGPDELYDFVDDAADNPTFYADLANPQSLNKYQYGYNNPLRYNDPDGHCPDCAAQVIKWVAPLIPAIPLAPPIAVVGAIAVIAASIPGDNTQGDGSCPSCDVYIRNSQRRLEQQEADRLNLRNQNNSGDQSKEKDFKPVEGRDTINKTPHQANREAKRKSGVPTSQTHDTHREVRDRTNPGKTVVEHDYTVRGKGGRRQVITIPNHRNGHPKGKVPRHFNDTNGGHHIY